MSRTRPSRLVACWIAAVSGATLIACASPVPVGTPGEPPSPTPTPSGSSTSTSRSNARTAAAAAATPVQPGLVRWPIKTAEHIDLWLHAFAMISPDTSAVPLYRRGYRDSLTVIKNRLNLLTSLDANRQTLEKRLATSSGYLMAQFLPLDMANWDVLRSFAERFLQLEGEPRRASDKETAARIQQFAQIFPNAADREWLRLFLAGVTDEQVKFFADDNSRAVRSRAAVVTAVDSLWQRVYRQRFERFLNNTGQRTGDIVLSTPIGGEGRTGIGRNQQIVVVVPFPQRVEEAPEVLYVFAHEITGTLVGSVVADNITPAQQRAGANDQLISRGQVRAGALVLQYVAPELLTPYMRYYLSQAGATSDASLPSGALAAAFAKRFELPDAIRDGLVKQIEIVLGGI